MATRCRRAVPHDDLAGVARLRHEPERALGLVERRTRGAAAAQAALAQLVDQAREHAADQRRVALAGLAPVDDEVAEVAVQRLDPLPAS